MAVRQAPKAQFNHPEAFRLMPYRCETCGNLEQIWNSRDGVTPFMTSCPVEGCDGLAQHVFPREAGRPELFSETLPGEADRVFVSMTREDCEKVVADRVEQMKQQGRDPSELTTEHIVHAIDRLYEGGTQPMVVSVEEYDRRNQTEKEPDQVIEVECVSKDGVHVATGAGHEIISEVSASDAVDILADVYRKQGLSVDVRRKTYFPAAWGVRSEYDLVIGEVELEESFQCQEFARLYRFAGIGQVVAMLDLDPDGEAQAEIRFHFLTGVDGLGLCQTALCFMDDEKGEATEKAEAAFEKLTPEMAERIVGNAADKIREIWDATREGSGND